MQIPISDLRFDYGTVVKTVMTYGSVVTTRGLTARELTNANVIIRDVGNRTPPNSRSHCECLPVGTGRSVNLGLAAVEALQLTSGTFSSELILAALPTFTHVLEDPDTLRHGAYGPRLDDSLDFIVRELRADPGSRRCFASIWKPTDLTTPGDRPCTIGLQFLIRGDALDAFTYMRSNDAWLGMPYDVWSFTQLQHTLARMLGVSAGDYHHTVTSLHVYETDWQRTTDLKSPTRLKPVGLPQGLVVPLPADLPASAPHPEHDWTTVRKLARALLGGTATQAERAANPWYATRLDVVRAKISPLPY